MTELQWLIKMLTKEKLSTHLKDLFIERIGEVELKFMQPKITAPGNAIMVHNQAPSTQRILDEMQQAPTPAPIMTKRIVGGEVDTGRGTKGPRKF